MSNIQRVDSLQTGEHCSSELASTGAVLEVQLAACHVHPHSSRGISALLEVLLLFVCFFFIKEHVL